MILISIKSDLMNVKRQYETDKEAEKYLKDVETAHTNERIRLTRRHIYETKGVRAYEANKTLRQVASVAPQFIKDCLKLRVSIINTNQNQLNFAHELK